MTTALPVRTVFALTSLCLLPHGAAASEPAGALIREADPLPDQPDIVVASIGNAAVNHAGGFAGSLTSEDDQGNTISHVWGTATGADPMLIRSEGQFDDLLQTSFETFFGLSDAGSIGYSAISISSTAGVTLDGAWRDDDNLLNELDPVPPLPGQFSTFNSRVGITGNNVLYWVGGITDTQGGSTQNRALFTASPDAGTIDAVLVGGQMITGVPEPIETGSNNIDFDVRFSELGSSYITKVQVDTGSNSDDDVVVIDGAALAIGLTVVREQNPVPPMIGGLPDERWDNFDFFGITEAGRYLFTGDTDASTSMDEIVVLDGVIELREGTPVDLPSGETGVLSGSIEGAWLNLDGDVALIWDVDLPDGSNVEALLVNGEVVLLEGDAVDWNNDGVIDAGDEGAVVTNFTGISALAMGDRDDQGRVRVYVPADVDLTDGSTLEGLFCLPVLVGEPACPGDIDGSGAVGVDDLLALLAAFGETEPNPADLDGSGVVDINDLLILLAAWGPCP